MSDVGIDLASLEPDQERQLSAQQEISPEASDVYFEEFAPEFEETWYLEPVEGGYRPVRVVEYYGGMEPPDIPDHWRQPVYVPEHEHPEPPGQDRRTFMRQAATFFAGVVTAEVAVGLGLRSYLSSRKSNDAAVQTVGKKLSKDEQEALALIDKTLEQIREEKMFGVELLNAPEAIRETAARMLEERLEDPKTVPLGSEALAWFRDREILKLLDAKKAAPYEATTTRVVGALIQEYNGWRDAENPIAKLDQGVCEYKEIVEYVDQRSRDRLLGRIRLYDRQMHAKPELLDDYLGMIIRRSSEGFLVGGQFELDSISVPDTDKNMKEYLLGQANVTENADGTLEYDWKIKGQKFTIDAGRVGSEDDGYYEYIRFISDADPLQQIVLSPTALKTDMDSGGLSYVARRTELFRAAESLGKGDLKNFDLPKGQKTAYIRVFPEERDSVIDGAVTNGMAMATTLRKVYGEDVDLKPLVFSTDAARDVTAAISSAHAEGRRSFFVDLYGHGGTNAISLGSDLTSEDVIKIVDAFPDSTFIFSTIACHGGHFVSRLHTQTQGVPDRQKRLLMMTQAKAGTVNLMVSGLQADGRYTDVHASLYYANFQKKLLDGATFGAAIRYADLETKKATSLDGGTLFKGQWIAEGEAEAAPNFDLRDTKAV